ncbi:hypothetical protein QE152_g8038 [Popillia japonica]|uniref:Uncharacterized protein n=1 Tax=Popillia japonica TaxID=7064 RepID=A0AAW1MDH2_POPJA
MTDSQPRNRKLRDYRSLKRPAKYSDYVTEYTFARNNANVAMIGEVEDILVSEALKDRNWRKAMTEEFESLTKMKTWNLVKQD